MPIVYACTKWLPAKWACWSSNMETKCDRMYQKWITNKNVILWPFSSLLCWKCYSINFVSPLTDPKWRLLGASPKMKHSSSIKFWESTFQSKWLLLLNKYVIYLLNPVHLMTYIIQVLSTILLPVKSDAASFSQVLKYSHINPHNPYRLLQQEVGYCLLLSYTYISLNVNISNIYLAVR